MEYELDDLDHGIIKHLSEDGRLSFTDLSKCLNVTEKTIRLRYKNLKDKEILDIVGIVNPIAVGLKTGAIILMKVKPKMLQAAIEELKKIVLIRYITVISGEYPLLVQITVKSQDKITEVVYAINEIEEITEVKTLIQLELHKNTFEYIR